MKKFSTEAFTSSKQSRRLSSHIPNMMVLFACLSMVFAVFSLTLLIHIYLLIYSNSQVLLSRAATQSAVPGL